MNSRFPRKGQAELDLQQQEGESKISWLERLHKRWLKKKDAEAELDRVLNGKLSEMKHTIYIGGQLLSTVDSQGAITSPLAPVSLLTEIYPNQPFYRRSK